MGKTSYRGVYTRENKDGSVSYAISYYHPRTGRRVQKVLKGVKSAAEASKFRAVEVADAMRDAQERAYNLRKSPSRAMSFEEAVRLYLEWSRENKKSAVTDEHRAKKLLKAFEGKNLGDITPFLVEKFKVLRAKQVSKLTVNKEIIFGSQVFKKAALWGKWKGSNPFLEAGRFEVKKGKKPGSLSPEDVAAIMEAITHPVKRDMVEFAYHTGWRISEIRGLRWEDLDLDQGRAWIVDPKNKNTVEIELSEAAVEIIKRQRKRGEHVFCHLNGNPFRTNLHKVLQNAAARAGIVLPHRKAWHILRRTWASMMLQAGCDVETLRQLGNWKDHSMPLWYADAAQSRERRRALNKVPRVNQTVTKRLREENCD